MIYASGEPVRIGDTVNLGGDQAGTVVAIIDENSYAEGYNAEDWGYLETGLVVSTSFGDLRLEEPDEDLELVARPEPRYRHAS